LDDLLTWRLAGRVRIAQAGDIALSRAKQRSPDGNKKAPT
jgi:hypothetical protein